MLQLLMEATLRLLLFELYRSLLLVSLLSSMQTSYQKLQLLIVATLRLLLFELYRSLLLV